MTRTLSLCFALSLSLASLAGCGGGDDSTPATHPPFRTPTIVTQGGDFHVPLDAAPSPDGATFYFVARDGAHGPGLYRAPASGGAAVEVSVGAPFATPRGLAISTDGQRIVVADATAGMHGGLYVVPVAGGAPTLLPGTEGTAPQGLEIVAQGGADQVYFTGAASDGSPAVFQIPLAGGAARVLAQGGMLRHPQGVAVTRGGVAFVSDRVDAMTGTGAVYRIEGAAVTTLVNNVRLGDPAGITLTPDERVLGVSSLDPSAGTSQVLLVDLASGMTSTFNQVINASHSAGGLHRAHGGASTDFAWADCTYAGNGRVVKVTLY